MMRAAVVLACVVAAVGTEISFTPTKKVIEGAVPLWERMVMQRGDKSLQAVLDLFTPDARLCFNGMCGPRDSVRRFIVDGYKNFNIDIHDAIYQRTTFHVFNTITIEVGVCSGQFEVVYSGYLNDAGKIKEMHEWYDPSAERFLGKSCAEGAHTSEEF